ncbi:MAG: cytochrome P450 [Robiginitalea sp.]|nr:cytochrome P450 [Robiginitalea sp.]
MPANPKTQGASDDGTGQSSGIRLEHIHQVSPWTVLRNRRRILKNPLPFHHEKFEAYGDTFKIKITPKTRVVFTRDPVIVRHVLQKNHRNYAKSELQTRDVAKYIGQGILTSEGEFWRMHRKMIQPAFHKERLQGLLGLMYQAIRTELSRIPEGEQLDMFPWMSDLAFQVVAQSLFSAGDLRKDMNRLQEITETNQQMLIREMRQPYLKWWFQASGQIRRHLHLAADARGLLDRLIEIRVKSGRPEGDLLDMLLEARYEDGGAMSRRQLIDEVLILFTAGHETTANALSFTLFLLARHPDIQKKAFESLQDLDFDKGGVEELLQGLGYVQQCVEEAMRLYPPVYVIDRVSLAAEELQGHTYPAGTTWLLSLFELHRHPDLWEAPESFRPSRFHPDRKKEHTRFYFPFGAGPRMCIGNNFAMYEMLLAVGWLVKRYRIHTSMEQLELNPLISLKPGQVFLRLEAR